MSAAMLQADVLAIAMDATQEGRKGDAMRILLDECDMTLEQAYRALTPRRDPQAGDILECSWGYEQTRVDFYQVVKVTKASVRIRKIAKRYVERGLYGDATVVPDVSRDPSEANRWSGGDDDDLKPLTRRFKFPDPTRHRWNGEADQAVYWRYSAAITSYSTAYLWDGEPCRESGDY